MTAVSTLYINTKRVSTVALDGVNIRNLEVTATGSVVTGGVAAVTISYLNASAWIDGSIFSEFDGIDITQNGTGAITVGSTGVIRGFSGIFLESSNNVIVNNGQISGLLDLTDSAAITIQDSTRITSRMPAFSPASMESTVSL